MLRLLLQPPRSLCASTDHYPHFPSWESVQPATARFPWYRDNFPERTHSTPQAVVMSCLPLPPQARPTFHTPPSSLAWVSQSAWISRYFNPVLSKQRTDALRWPTCRGRAKSRPEPQELCEQRREREISPGSPRSSGLNLHNQLDVPCICGIPEYTTNHPKIEAAYFGSNCTLGVCYLHLICFWFSVYLSLVFIVHYHWYICLLIWLLSSFFFTQIYIDIYFIFLFRFLWVHMCMLLCVILSV